VSHTGPLTALPARLTAGLLPPPPRAPRQRRRARSFHAAVQARNIAGYALSGHAEEVFIAALLHHLGELAFWGCAGEQADELVAVLERPGVDVDEAVREVLGTSFRQLTQALLKSWNLGETASLAQAGSNQHDPAAYAVQLGVRISEAALDGWDCAEMEEVLARVASFTALTQEETLQQVLASAEEAVKVASTFGASKLCRLIPNTDPEQIRLQQEERRARLLQPDLLLMQQALQDLGLMVSARADVGLVLDTLLKGLHRGVGLERVMLTVLADGQSRFRAKRVVGEDTQHWLEDFVLPAEQTEQPHIFSYVLRHREAIWMGVPASYNLAELVTQPIRRSLGSGMFFIAPIVAGTREIGVLYADSRLSGRALRHEQFVAFQRFTQLTGRCLEAISKR
ncbi:HDOD domain-containing protein, partial [Ectopseudomonas khazarica]|uniref:HDOD domain-containing protein n=1 Tax=Ectopseudomonas khazarica TaxID=2502979 RepID=UPI003B955617